MLNCAHNSYCEELTELKRVLRLEEASNDLPQPLTTYGNEGISYNYSRADHEHPAIAPTPSTGDSSTKVATTEFVSNMLNELDDTDLAESGKFTTDVVQTNGKVTISNKSFVTGTIKAASSVIDPVSTSDFVNVVSNDAVNFTSDPTTANLGSFLAVKVPTEKYINDRLSSVYIYKGSKTNYNNLPTTGNTIGDVWNVDNAVTVDGKTYPAGTNYAWNGNSWDPLGGLVNISIPSTVPTIGTSPTLIGTINGIEFKAKIPNYPTETFWKATSGDNTTMEPATTTRKNITGVGTLTATTIYLTSDKSMKLNIQSINNLDLEKVSQVQLKGFEMKNNPGVVKYGVIALLVLDTGLNNLVEENGGVLRVDYTSFLILKIALLEKEILKLKNEKITE